MTMKLGAFLFGPLLCLSACGAGGGAAVGDPGDVEIPLDSGTPATGGRTAGRGGGAGAGGTGPGAGGAQGGAGGAQGGAGPDAGGAQADAGGAPADAARDDGASDGGADAPGSTTDALPAGSDGALGDSGTPGLGQAASCASGAGVLCEDFEKTAPGEVPAGWTRQGSAVVSAEGPARGMRALLAKSAVNTVHSINRVTRRLTLPGTHWGRVYLRVALPSPRPPSGVIHANFVTLLGGLAEGGRSAEFRVVDVVIASNNRYQYLYNVQPSGAGEFGRTTGFNWSFDGKWHCMEWFIDQANQEFRLHVDGAETPVLAFKNGAGNYARSQIPKTFNGIQVGVTHHQNSRSGFVVSFDELVVDGKRVGCK